MKKRLLSKHLRGEILMPNEFSLINIDGLSDVAIKLLDMIGKSVGWIVMPRGKRADFKEGLEVYKKAIMDDCNLSGIEKGAKISSASMELRKYINQGKIVSIATENLESTAAPEKIGVDWLNTFFTYAENISNEEMQHIWGKLLASKANGNNGITKKTLQIFYLIEAEDISTFCKICSLTFDNVNHPLSCYPFIYIKKYAAYYNDLGIKRYHLASLDNLGLIEFDIHSGFVLPKEIPQLQFGSTIIQLSSTKRINNGNIRFTTVGRALYELTNVEKSKNFLDYYLKIWKDENISCNITTMI